MTLMNESEVESSLRIFDNADTPNLDKGACVLYDLVGWTNSHSDGWPYWQKPSRAASRLMQHLQAAKTAYYRGEEIEDITDKELTAALSPIKAFLTRQGVDHSEIFDGPYCNHDAVAVVVGVCECGEKVSLGEETEYKVEWTIDISARSPIE